jgi:hypothetical protein
MCVEHLGGNKGEDKGCDVVLLAVSSDGSALPKSLKGSLKPAFRSSDPSGSWLHFTSCRSAARARKPSQAAGGRAHR